MFQTGTTLGQTIGEIVGCAEVLAASARKLTGRANATAAQVEGATVAIATSVIDHTAGAATDPATATTAPTAPTTATASGAAGATRIRCRARKSDGQEKIHMSEERGFTTRAEVAACAEEAAA